MTKGKRFIPLHILSRNGWEWVTYEKDYLSTTDDLCQYKTQILGDSYHSTVIALVSEAPCHLDLDGCYGVMWLEAKYECERNGCLSWDDMADMQQAIIYAEENLLRIGMPFTEDYEFHGKNTANKRRRNAKLRKDYNLAEKEQKDNERRKL